MAKRKLDIDFPDNSQLLGDPSTYYFNSWKDYLVFGDYINADLQVAQNKETLSEVRSKMTNPSWVRERAEWYGTDSVEDLLVTPTQFIEPEVIQLAADISKDIATSIQFGDNFKKPVLVADSLPIGVFSFSLASKGMEYVIEYYCPKFNQLADPSAIRDKLVNPDGFIKFEDGELYQDKREYFILREGGKVECTPRVSYQKEYFVPKLDGMVVDGKFITQRVNKGLIEFVYTDEDGKEFVADFRRAVQEGKSIPNVKTRTKKIYLRREAKVKKERVKLLVGIGGVASWSSYDLAYRPLPAIILASFLEMSNIDVGIDYAMLQKESDRMDRAMCVGVKAKEYGDKIDYNQILIHTSDSREFRAQGFMSIIANYDSIGVGIGMGLGQTMSLGDITEGRGLAYEKFEQFKRNYMENYARDGEIRSELILASQMPGTPARGDEQERKTEYISRAVGEVYRTLAVTDMLLNENPRSTLETFVRVVRENRNGYLKDDLKRNMLSKQWIENGVLNAIKVMNNVPSKTSEERRAAERRSRILLKATDVLNEIEIA